MTRDARMGDRRGQLRYDISGQLWGALNVRTPIVLRNIATGGALLEARLSTGLKSLRTAQIALREEGPQVSVVVRHAAPVSDAPDEDRYLLGVEFVNLSPAARADIERRVQDLQAPGTGV